MWIAPGGVGVMAGITFPVPFELRRQRRAKACALHEAGPGFTFQRPPWCHKQGQEWSQSTEAGGSPELCWCGQRLKWRKMRAHQKARLLCPWKNLTPGQTYEPCLIGTWSPWASISTCKCVRKTVLLTRTFISSLGWEESNKDFNPHQVKMKDPPLFSVYLEHRSKFQLFE